MAMLEALGCELKRQAKSRPVRDLLGLNQQSMALRPCLPTVSAVALAFHALYPISLVVYCLFPAAGFYFRAAWELGYLGEWLTVEDPKTIWEAVVQGLHGMPLLLRLMSALAAAGVQDTTNAMAMLHEMLGIGFRPYERLGWVS